MTVTSCPAIAQHMRQPRHLGFRPFVVTHFNPSLSAYREWSRRIEERQHGWRVGFSQTPTIKYVTVNLVQLFIQYVRWKI
jgi:hypothetical protein